MTNDANNRNGRGNQEERNADSRFLITKNVGSDFFTIAHNKERIDCVKSVYSGDGNISFS